MKQTTDAKSHNVNFAYDLVGRPGVFTDQKGDTVTHSFDMAGRLVGRDDRLAVNSPSGTIADTDSFTFDDAGANAYGRQWAIQQYRHTGLW